MVSWTHTEKLKICLLNYNEKPNAQFKVTLACRSSNPHSSPAAGLPRWDFAEISCTTYTNTYFYLKLFMCRME